MSLKPTGIIRRIDELGRIVIPKEVRRAMRIKEGDPLEIFPSDEGIFLKKHASHNTIEDVLQELNAVVSDADELECQSLMLGKIKEFAELLKSANDERMEDY